MRAVPATAGRAVRSGECEPARPAAKPPGHLPPRVAGGQTRGRVVPLPAAACRAMATAHGFEVGEVASDLDVGGGTMDRPGLKASLLNGRRPWLTVVDEA